MHTHLSLSLSLSLSHTHTHKQSLSDRMYPIIYLVGIKYVYLKESHENSLLYLRFIQTLKYISFKI
jgi:hypothetical protein